MKSIFRILVLLGISSIAYSSPGIDWSQSRGIALVGVIEGRMAYAAATGIEKLMAQGEKEIKIFINSPGGNVDAGYLIVASMQNARAQGVRIQCAVSFLAASMAMHILAYCDDRFVLPETLLLFHEIATVLERATPTSTEQVKEQLRILAKPLEENLISQLGTDEETFRHHNELQTLWPAIMFDRAFPAFGLQIVNYIKLPEGVGIFNLQ